jgi:hypothetical protein
MSLRRTLHPDPDVVDTELEGGEVALLHLGTKTYFTLNTTGARVWRHVKDGRSLEEASRSLQAEFGIGSEQAERSVTRLAGELLRHRLVSSHPA